MAQYYSPKIVTSGLVTLFDAANNKSYPGSGTKIYDLSATRGTGTFTGTLSYSTLGGGSLSFDGSNSYVSFSNPLGQSATAQVWTVQSWINITHNGVALPQCLVLGMNNGNIIEAWQGNNSIMYLSDGVNDYYTYGGQFTAQGWVMATFRFNNANGNRQILRNLTDTSTGGPNNTSTPSGLAANFTMGNYALGNIANLLIYNRYLSDSELLQNYEAQRGRFGV